MVPSSWLCVLPSPHKSIVDLGLGRTECPCLDNCLICIYSNFNVFAGSSLLNFQLGYPTLNPCIWCVFYLKSPLLTSSSTAVVLKNHPSVIYYPSKASTYTTFLVQPTYSTSLDCPTAVSNLTWPRLNS